jgi:hypothetical protein
MTDKIRVKYDTIEQLFCQKQMQAKIAEPTKLRMATEVSHIGIVWLDLIHKY